MLRPPVCKVPAGGSDQETYCTANCALHRNAPDLTKYICWSFIGSQSLPAG